jgi:hypothetical protein
MVLLLDRVDMEIQHDSSSRGSICRFMECCPVFRLLRMLKDGLMTYEPLGKIGGALTRH